MYAVVLFYTKMTFGMQDYNKAVTEGNKIVPQAAAPDNAPAEKGYTRPISSEELP